MGGGAKPAWTRDMTGRQMDKAQVALGFSIPIAVIVLYMIDGCS